MNTKTPLVPDVLSHGLTLVFCGTAPSAVSAAQRAYYAHPGNRFWPTLHQHGFIPAPLRPVDYAQLQQHGIGLTDICKYASGNDDELPRDLLAGDEVRAKITQWQPRLLAFTSKFSARQVLERNPAYGLQPETIGATQIHVMPSTSGRARRFWVDTPWVELAAAYRAAHGAK